MFHFASGQRPCEESAARVESEFDNLFRTILQFNQLPCSVIFERALAAVEGLLPYQSTSVVVETPKDLSVFIPYRLQAIRLATPFIAYLTTARSRFLK